MKKLFILFLLFISNYMFGQTFTNSNQPYKAKNGIEFKIGDTILITTPYDFSNVYKSYYSRKTKKQEAITKIDNYTFDSRRRIHIIKQFKINAESVTFAVFDKLFNEMVDIELGIETGEIANDFLKEIYKSSKIYFTDSIAYLNYLKRANALTNEQVKEFIFLFDNKKYNSFREDEFQFNSEIRKTKEFLTKELSIFNLEKNYYIFTDLQFGNYDFDSLSFPLKWKGEAMDILNDTWETFTTVDMNKIGVDLTNLKLVFTNIENFSAMPLNEEKAKLLVNYRKDETGVVNRDLKAGIKFKIKELKKEENQNYLLCEIIRLDLFEDKDLYNYLNSIK